MYLHGKEEVNIKRPLRITRALLRVNFNKATKCTGKYLNSPFYKGTLLWDKLDKNLQHANNVKRAWKNCTLYTKKLVIVVVITRLYNISYIRIHKSHV